MVSHGFLAKMAGISEWTIKRFEPNGQITLEALVLIATALGATRQIAELFKHERPVSLEEIKTNRDVPEGTDEIHQYL